MRTTVSISSVMSSGRETVTRATPGAALPAVAATSAEPLDTPTTFPVTESIVATDWGLIDHFTGPGLRVCPLASISTTDRGSAVSPTNRESRMGDRTRNVCPLPETSKHAAAATIVNPNRYRLMVCKRKQECPVGGGQG